MTDDRPGNPVHPDSAMSEVVDHAIRRISTAVVLAGAIVALAVYARPGPPRFEAVVDGDRIVRIDTRKGTIISCEGQQTCQVILRSRQRVVPVKRSDAPAAAPALARPAPATPPAAAPAAGKSAPAPTG